MLSTHIGAVSLRRHVVPNFAIPMIWRAISSAARQDRGPDACGFPARRLFSSCNWTRSSSRSRLPQPFPFGGIEQDASERLGQRRNITDWDQDASAAAVVIHRGYPACSPFAPPKPSRKVSFGVGSWYPMIPLKNGTPPGRWRQAAAWWLFRCRRAIAFSWRHPARPPPAWAGHSGFQQSSRADALSGST